MNLKFKIITYIVSVIVVLVLIYLYAMFIGTAGLITKEYIINNDNFIEEYNGFKIAHISDIHYGNHMPIKKINTLVEKINNANIDLIVLTGDLVDHDITNKEHEEIRNALVNLKAKYGKYAINGNHDTLYKNFEKLIDEIGFNYIKDSYEKIYLDNEKYIFLAGISDSINNKVDINKRSKEILEYMENNNDNSIANILLIHEPDEIDKIDYNKFDTILSGHSHNGQVRLPFIGAIYVPVGSKKYYKEYYNLGTDLYISSGVGLSWLPIRLFNKPSYNVYRIIKK